MKTKYKAQLKHENWLHKQKAKNIKIISPFKSKFEEEDEEAELINEAKRLTQNYD